jgi:hypothetical protein
MEKASSARKSAYPSANIRLLWEYSLLLRLVLVVEASMALSA